MTDKQIITKSQMIMRIAELSANLEAKEQECEELKGISIKKCPKCGEVYLNSVGIEAFDQLNQLKAENEELKKDVIEALKLVEITSTHNTFQETKINRLSKTLTEIKEIAEKHKKDESVWNPYRQLDKILQKISECEGK